MTKIVKPYADRADSKKEQVQEMFDKVSSKYDFLNRILSLGIDISWRNKVVKIVNEKNPKDILDIATGTGDLAISIAEKNKTAKVIGFDLSEGMLSYGRKKITKKGLDSNIKMIQGDAENMPFEDNTFDVVTVSFGVRNFENLEKGLIDIYRVLKPNGKLVILEFSTPEKFPMKQLYAFHSKYILPTVGNFFSEDSTAYDYLPNSIKAFPYGEKMVAILENCGYKNTYCKKLTSGISSIYVGEKK